MAKRHTNGYMVYGCDHCEKGFKMYLEDTLETHDPKTHKPVPFTIQCPFCKSHDCHDVSGKISIPRQKLTKRMPAFWNVEGDDCGKPMNMEQAEPEYQKQATPLQASAPGDGERRMGMYAI